MRTRVATLVGEVEGVEEVREAASAREALELLGTFRPDLILLDLHLPGGSGLDVLAQVKVGAPPRPVVVVVTNDAGERQRRDCLARGADHFLDKSTEFERILEIVADVVRARRSSGS